MFHEAYLTTVFYVLVQETYILISLVDIYACNLIKYDEINGFIGVSLELYSFNKNGDFLKIVLIIQTLDEMLENK